MTVDENESIKAEADVDVEVDVDVDNSELNIDDVPAELQGLSESTIKEIMAEAGNDDEGESEELEKNDGYSTAEPDSDNKQSKETEVLDRPKQKIPYERFKNEVDKNKNLKDELDKLRAELEQYKAGTANNPPQQQSSQQSTQPQEMPKPPVQPQFNKEQIEAINTAIQQRAMSMSGLSEEEINSIEYMDDEDERKVRWKFAQNMATQEVHNSIQQARYEQAERAKQILDYHDKVTAGYNKFVKEQMNEPDFENIKAHATGEYFNNASPDMQPIIADAYARIERNMASPQDIAVVQRFFIDAKNDYLSKGGKKNTNAANRVKQATAQPRAGQVEGSAASAGTPSVAALERMLNEKSWEDIPDEYKAILKGL